MTQFIEIIRPDGTGSIFVNVATIDHIVSDGTGSKILFIDESSLTVTDGPDVIRLTIPTTAPLSLKGRNA